MAPAAAGRPRSSRLWTAASWPDALGGREGCRNFWIPLLLFTLLHVED